MFSKNFKYFEHFSKVPFLLFFVLLAMFLSSDRTGNCFDLSFAWNASALPDLAGYRLFCRQQGQTYDDNNPVWQGTEITCTISGLIENTTYYFVLTAYDIYGNESENSVEWCYDSQIIDRDGDGMLDAQDAFPDNPGEWLDSDSDGVGNNADSDDDNDGISDEEEESGPNDGDSNNDGIPDSTQGNVSNLNIDGTQDYITLESPDGTEITDCQCSEPPPDAPASAVFDYGLFEFTLEGLAAGDSTTVTLTLPNTSSDFDTYYKYGPTPDNTTAHRYEFIYDGETGADIDNDNNVITLYFIDGARGDDDLTANGTVVDIGGPARTVTTDDDGDDSGGGSGDCFITTVHVSKSLPR
jgi:hypothetical protein